MELLVFYLLLVLSFSMYVLHPGHHAKQIIRKMINLREITKLQQYLLASCSLKSPSLLFNLPFPRTFLNFHGDLIPHKILSFGANSLLSYRECLHSLLAVSPFFALETSSKAFQRFVPSRR